mmetsp:Transcript_12185/g.16857  ORF Transcript_12185/g.16857 Transcript_12185/m.16857 type:complete len:131 (-) Transcript_12185:173-565(-)
MTDGYWRSHPEAGATHRLRVLQPLRGSSKSREYDEHGNETDGGAAGNQRKAERSSKKKGNECRRVCFECVRKLPALGGFECRCLRLYCRLHRLPHQHNCTFDYKHYNQIQLRKANQKLFHRRRKRLNDSL